MVKDTISNAKLYYGLGERFEKALKALENLDPAAMEPGKRYELEGDNLHYNMQKIETKFPDNEYYEAHIKYADIQYVISGEEYMGWELKKNLAQRQACKPGEDIEWYRGEGTMLRFQPGDFAIFFPDDAHMPCRNDGKAVGSAVKVVVKVRL